MEDLALQLKSVLDRFSELWLGRLFDSRLEFGWDELFEQCLVVWLLFGAFVEIQNMCRYRKNELKEPIYKLDAINFCD